MDPVQGPEAIKEFIAGFTAAFDKTAFREDTVSSFAVIIC